jgi:peptide/nickel transport system substrate-binding protein
MTRFVYHWLVVNSLLIAGLPALAETRAQYGGTLRVSTRTVLTSLAPQDLSQPGSMAQQDISELMFDTLVKCDERGRIYPGLAVSWRIVSGSQRWRFQLRRGVKFHDSTPLSAETTAAALRAANPSWNVAADSDAVVIELSSADPELLAELSLPKNAIVKKDSPDRPVGTGPFRILTWEPGKKLTLAAQEDYWDGRPFLDSIEIEMGKSFRDQSTAIALSRTDLAEIAPEQTHRILLEGQHMASSAPVELIALVFARETKTPEEKSLREALSLSIDRESMRTVLLQGAGQPAGSLLPNWMSGYGFVFPTKADVALAHKERDQVRSAPAWTLGYDPGDPLVRLLAERIALNAKDSGLMVQPTTATGPDIRLLRIPMISANPWISLAKIADFAGAQPLRISGSSAEDLYKEEIGLLSTRRIIPLFHLPVTYAASPALKNWTVQADGRWGILDAWLEARRP